MPVQCLELSRMQTCSRPSFLRSNLHSRKFQALHRHISCGKIRDEAGTGVPGSGRFHYWMDLWCEPFSTTLGSNNPQGGFTIGWTYGVNPSQPPWGPTTLNSTLNYPPQAPADAVLQSFGYTCRSGVHNCPEGTPASFTRPMAP